MKKLWEFLKRIWYWRHTKIAESIIENLEEPEIQELNLPPPLRGFSKKEMDNIIHNVMGNMSKEFKIYNKHFDKFYSGLSNEYSNVYRNYGKLYNELEKMLGDEYNVNCTGKDSRRSKKIYDK